MSESGRTRTMARTAGAWGRAADTKGVALRCAWRMGAPAGSVVALLVLVLALALPHARAAAHGPGAHLREADRTLELLSERDEAWASLADAEMASSYLRLGSIAPDFQWISGALGFGHSKRLSYHLIDITEDMEPRFRLFALGHLAHILSDANAEMFLTPTAFGMVPIGLLNVFEGQEDLQAESETLCEGFGDMQFGDWLGVVDLIYDFYLDGEPAIERATEILLWYCEAGRSFHGLSTDCDRVLADILGALGTADDLLPASRVAGRRTIELLIGGDVLNLFATGFLSFLLGTDATPSRIHDRELARVRASAMGERAFWVELYEEHFLDLAPRWTVDHLRTRSTDWPDWEARAIVAGNIQSLMQFVPEYRVVPGLLVDEIHWRDVDGEILEEATSAMRGAEATVSARFYSTMRWSGEVRAVVRGDRPGLSRAEDPVLGEATFRLEIDPAEYTERPRDVLTVPFVVEPEDVLGFYLELTADDAHGPFFTTSVDRFWTIDALDLDDPIYLENLMTYGGFPQSLPVAGAEDPLGTIFVKVITGPAGFGFSGAAVGASVSAETRITGDGGIAVFDRVSPGPVEVWADAPTHEGRAAAAVEAVQGEHVWVQLVLARRPEVEGPAGWSTDARCVAYRWNEADFGGQAQTVRVVLARESDGTVLHAESLPASARRVCVAEALADGERLVVSLTPEFDGDGEAFAVEGRSAPFGVDSSPPVVDVLATRWVEPPPVCGPPEGLELELRVEETHSQLEAVLWRTPQQQASEATVVEGAQMPLPEGGIFTVLLADPAVRLERNVLIGASNTAGLQAFTSVSVGEVPSWRRCAEGEDPWGESPSPSSPGEATAGEDDDPGLSSTGSGGGCGCAGASGPYGSGWALIVLVGVAMGRRRGRGRPMMT